MRKKEALAHFTDNSSRKGTSQMEALLYLLNVTSDFSAYQLQGEIKEFESFERSPKIARLNREAKIEAFVSKKHWTGDEAKDYRIGSAIFLWLSLIDRQAIRNLITEKDKEGNWVYQYKCSKCKQVFHQIEYDRFEQDEATSTLLEKEFKKCPRCNDYGVFINVRKRKQSWITLKHLRKMDRIQDRVPQGIPATSEQLNNYDLARDAWDKVAVKKWERMTTNRFPKGAEIDAWRKEAKPFLEDIYKTSPIDIKLCARPDCFERLPSGSRRGRLYCSSQCKSIMKTRRARGK